MASKGAAARMAGSSSRVPRTTAIPPRALRTACPKPLRAPVTRILRPGLVPLERVPAAAVSPMLLVVSEKCLRGIVAFGGPDVDESRIDAPGEKLSSFRQRRKYLVLERDLATGLDHVQHVPPQHIDASVDEPRRRQRRPAFEGDHTAGVIDRDSARPPAIALPQDSERRRAPCGAMHALEGAKIDVAERISIEHEYLVLADELGGILQRARGAERDVL